jgi:flagellar biosynthesis chaperone FliJ
MKRFSFPLQRVRDWRKTQEDLERAKLQQLFAERRQLEIAAAELATSLSNARREVQELAAGQGRLSSGDLVRLDDFGLFARHRCEVLAAQRRKLEEQIGRQTVRLVEARRGVRLLDKLKERQFSDWEKSYYKEIEEMAGEQFLARWNEKPPA